MTVHIKRCCPVCNDTKGQWIEAGNVEIINENLPKVFVDNGEFRIIMADNGNMHYHLP